MSALASILAFLSAVWQRSVEIFVQPSFNKQMLWILLPLLTTMFIMQLYFGRYKKEELGWNSAVANSIVLFFVGFNILGYLHQNNMLVLITVPTNMEVAIIKSFIAFIIVIESFFLFVFNFFHAFRGKFAFEISSPLVLNFIGIMGIIITYSNIALDYITLVATIFLFFCLWIFFKLIKLAIPPSKKEQKEQKERT